MEDMLVVARHSESQPHVEVPMPGKDFPYFPEPSAAVLALTRDSLASAIATLTAKDLRTEGL